MPKLVLKIDNDAMSLCVNDAIEFFKHLESECLHDVDLKRCASDFIVAAMIYHTEWFKTEVIE